MKTHILILSFIVASRFFALFIVLPVIALYAQKLSGASAIGTGLIVGIYAIFQMLFSLPFGALSDVIGRKGAMLLGLVIFIIGSIICANASDIIMMLIGRSLQGMGAIGGVATAMIADLTSEKERGKAMALMGGSIGLSFAVAMILGPVLAHYAGLSSLFYFSAALSVLAAGLIFMLPSIKGNKTSINKADIRQILSSKNLFLLYLTNFLQKGLASATFMLIPLSFVNTFHHSSEELYKLYGAAMILGFLAMGFGGVVGESKGKSKHILLAGVALFAFSMFAFSDMQLYLFICAVFCFFAAFCLHEPIMQSSLSKICPANLKGSVLGLSNSCGYLGSFIGPLATAAALHANMLQVYLLALGALCILWFIALLFLENPNDFKIIHLGWGLDISALEVADSGQDKNGLWAKINIRKYSLEDIQEKIGAQISGASPKLQGSENEEFIN